MSNISFDMQANDENVRKTLVEQQKEIAKLTAELAKLNATTDETAKAAKEAAKAQADAAKEAAKAKAEAAKEQAAAEAALAKAQAEAARIIAANRTETEKLADESEKLWKLKEQGLLTEEQYSRALAAQTAQLTDSEEAQRKAAQAQAELNQETLEARRVVESLKGPEEKRQERIERLNKLREKGLLTEQQHAAAVAKEGQALDQNSKSAETFGSQLMKVGTELGLVVGGFEAIRMAIQQVREEYEALKRRQEEAASANIDLAKAQESLIENLGGENAGKVFGRVRELSQKTGVGEAQLTTTMNETLAARSDRSMEDVFAAVEAASKIKKLDPSKLPVMSAAILDIQKQTGLGTDQALGFLTQLQSQSRVKSMGALAENATPAVGGVMEFGADRGTSAAIYAALSHGMNDPTGAQSKTASIQLAKQLEAFGGAGSNIAETIATIQGSDAVRAEFMKGASFEAGALPAVRSLLGGGTQAKQFASAQQVFAGDPTAALNAAIEARAASPAIAIAEGKQSLDNFINQQQLGNVAGAESAVVRESMQKIRDSLGQTQLSQAAKGIFDDAVSGGYQNFEQAIAALQSERDSLRIGQSELTNGLGWIPGMAAVKGGLQARNAQANIATVEQMDSLINELKRQNDRFEAQANAGAAVGKAAAQREK